MTDDTVTAKLAQWAALTEAATEGPWEAVSSEVTMNDRSEWRIGDRSRPQVLRAQMRSADAEFIAAARTAMPALLGFVEDVRAMIRDRHRDIGATSDYDIGRRDGWDDSLRVVELALTKRIGGA